MIKKLGSSDDNIIAIWCKTGTKTNEITNIWIQVKTFVENSSVSYYKQLTQEFKKLCNLSVDVKAPNDTAFFKMYG